MAVINGTAGNDTLVGTSDADTISGGDGDDVIHAGDGNDTLYGGSGTNLLDGGAGSDTVSYGDATVGVTVSLAVSGPQNTGFSTDTLISIENLSGSNFADHLVGDDGNNVLSTGQSYTQFASIGRYTLGDVGDVLDGGAGNDTLIATANSNGSILNGGDGDDTINVSFSGNLFTALTGYATAIDGTPVRVNGGAGNDTISVLTHAIVNAGDGDDLISTGIGAITTGARVSLIYDVPAGTDRTLMLTGGAGSDTFVIENPLMTATITDFTIGVDKIDLGFSITFDASPNASKVFVGQQGGDTVYFSSANFDTVFARMTGVQASAIHQSDYVIIPAYGDRVVTDPSQIYTYGTSAAETFHAQYAYGGGGNDTLYGTLYGTSGPDHLYGGDGNDTFVVGSGGDYLDGGTGNNTVDYSGAASSVAVDLSKWTATVAGLSDVVLNFQTVVGSSFDDILIAAPVAATLFGGGGADTLIGGAANDQLIGGAGADTLTGGAGADTFAYQSTSDSTSSAADLITDFTTGSDVIDLSAVSPTSLSVIRQGGASFVFASTLGGSMVIDVNGAVNGGDISWGANHVGVYLVGDNTGDTLIGGSLGDSIHGGSGNDLVIGGAGADGLYGSAGADTFKYTAASDSTASATDLIFDFQTGQDKVDLTSLGVNHISTIDNGSAEFLFVETTSGAIMQIAAQGADAVQANDFLVTGGTNFYMQGDAGANTLIGGSGKDVLDGHDGNDVIIGGGGTDALFGGTGSDTFKYLAASDSTVSAPDTIFDLETGIDKIDLRGVHAAGVGSYGIAYSTTASYLFVDVNGDGVNDMLIQVGSPNLHVGDVLWT